MLQSHPELKSQSCWLPSGLSAIRCQIRDRTVRTLHWPLLTRNHQDSGCSFVCDWSINYIYKKNREQNWVPCCSSSRCSAAADGETRLPLVLWGCEWGFGVWLCDKWLQSIYSRTWDVSDIIDTSIVWTSIIPLVLYYIYILYNMAEVTRPFGGREPHSMEANRGETYRRNPTSRGRTDLRIY